MRVSEFNPTYCEINRIAKDHFSFRLLRLENNGIADAFGIRRMDYKKAGTDYRDGKMNLPRDVARAFALAILAETDADEVSK